jgi:hypothetical protein
MVKCRLANDRSHATPATTLRRDDSNTAGHTGFLTIDEPRQMAVDFARLPELLKRIAAL